jgi:hypothetical protein
MSENIGLGGWRPYGVNYPPKNVGKKLSNNVSLNTKIQAEDPWKQTFSDRYSCPHVNRKSLKILDAWKKGVFRVV